MTDKSLALIVDDEEDLCTLMKLTLSKMNIDSEVAYDVTSAKRLLGMHDFDFCLTDLNLPDGSGLDLVEHINENFTHIPVAVITAHGSMDLAIEALKLGAFDFVNKPLELPRLRQLIGNAIKVNVVQPDVADDTPAEDPSMSTLIGESDVIYKLRKTIKKLARSQAPVFLHGESGTGKEVVARLIHELSPRGIDGAFVPVNCGAIPSELMESEFFGHKKGSFTGAVSDKQGLFQMAHGGTLFLDEVADLPLNMQVKLLRAIQEKKVRPIGSQQEIAVDIRLLSATHKNLAELVQQGLFRQDLFYRINVIELQLPSLNERGNDILLLADHFIRQISQDWDDDEPPELSDSARHALMNHTFQGNVRELRNILERALTLCDGDEMLPEHLQLSAVPTTVTPLPSSMGAMTPDMPQAAEHPSITSNANGQHVDMLSARNPLVESTIEMQSLGAMFADATSQLRHDHPSMLMDALQFDAEGNVIPPMLTSTNTQAALSPTVSVETLPEGGLEAYLQSEEIRLMVEALELCKWNRTKAAERLGMSFRSFRYRMKKLGIADD